MNEQSYDKCICAQSGDNLLLEFNLLGWERNGETCSDIDECTTTTHKCGVYADCRNTDGSYSCDCMSGYENVATGGETLCTGREIIHNQQCVTCRSKNKNYIKKRE